MSESRDRAKVWKRFLAMLIDSVVIAFPTSFVAVIGVAAFVALGPILTQYNLQYLGIIAIPVLFAGVPWLYYAEFQSSGWQATPGKLLMDIQIEGTDRQALSFLAASGRFLGKHCPRRSRGLDLSWPCSPTKTGRFTTCWPVPSSSTNNDLKTTPYFFRSDPNEFNKINGPGCHCDRLVAFRRMRWTL